MRHLPPRHRGFTLVELLVVIAIIGTLVALLLPAVQSARESARSNTCKNNLRQLALALQNYDSSQSKLPGYINDLENIRGDKNADGYVEVRQASWLVMLFPYIEQTARWDNWTKFTPQGDATANISEIEMLICPSNEPEIPGAPSLAYVGNSGQRGGAKNLPQNAANGVFLDLSTNRNALPSSSAEDGREDSPTPQMSINYLSSNDGTSNTLMVSESLYNPFWTYTDDNGDPVFESTAKDQDLYDDPKYFGFVWSNDTGFNFINGIPIDSDDAIVQNQVNLRNIHAFPSSNHPSGVNAAFGDARVVYLNDTIDPQVYGQLMTSNARRSAYAPFNPNGTPDRKLPPVSSDQF